MMTMQKEIELEVFGSTDKQEDTKILAQDLADQLAEAISNSMNRQLNNTLSGGMING